MTGFFIGAALALAITLLLLLRPYLWQGRQAATASHRQLNAAIYRDQFAELERDRAEGTLGEDDYQQARQELQRRVLEDGGDDPTATAVPAPKKTMLALGLALPLAAAALYMLLGTPAGINPPPAQQRVSAEEIDRMVAGLAARLENEPGNLEGWLMLGRSYKAMGRFGEAEKAFEHAAPLVEKDAQLLAVYADIAAMNAGGSLKGKPSQLIEKALKLDPQNVQALWLSGSASFERQQFAQAAETWEKLLRLMPAESEDARQLAAGIEEARAKAGGGAKR